MLIDDLYVLLAPTLSVLVEPDIVETTIERRLESLIVIQDSTPDDVEDVSD